MQMEPMTTSSFLHRLLKDCTGSVMIDPLKWELPNGGFDRGYFNDRLKKEKSINKLTKNRLFYIFSYLFHPEGHKGKFQEPQAVEAANQLIKLFSDCFHTDLTLWYNDYAADNQDSRSCLLDCLDDVLSLCIDKEMVPVERIQEILLRHRENVIEKTTPLPEKFPEFLTSPPYRQTEYYTGRKGMPESLQKLIRNGTPCFLHGIGGIGKTEIAKALMVDILKMPSSQSGITRIAWVEYTDGDFALSLVRAFFPSSELQNMEQEFQKALSLINQYRDRLLLILDNVENLDDRHLMGIGELLPCRLLITSRCDGFSGFEKIPVMPLKMNECMDLFYYYYHGKHDDSSLRQIIELADRHTVTVELLSRIADTEEALLYEFLTELKKCGFHISSEEASTVHSKLRTEGRIIEQLQKLFRVYGRSMPETQLLMQTSAIPGIPFHFGQAKKWFAQENRTLLNRLARKGWLKKEAIYNNGRNRYRYIMHSVIAAAVRAQFLASLYEACQGFIREITIEMEESRNQNDSFKKELIQFSWSLNDIFTDSFKGEEDCRFLWALAEIYRDIGYYERAVPLLDSLFQLYTKLYGENCIQLASVWNSRGMIDYELSHFDTALEAYLKSRSIMEDSKGEGEFSATAKVELAKLDLNIGKIYLKSDYRKAEPFFKRAYETFLAEKGDSDELTLNALSHKAVLLAHSGEHKEAEELYLDLYGKTDAKSNDREMLFLRAGIAHNLGNLLTDYRPAEAMLYLQEAKDIFWKLLSPTHPDTLDVWNTICSLRLTLEDNYPDILEDFYRLLELFQKVYGMDDPNTATIFNNIGLCYYYMDQPQKAIENYREAIRIDSLSYGPEHEHTAYIYNNIGAVYSENDQPKKALPDNEHALRIYETYYPDHKNLDLAQTHADLADAYLRIGDLDKVMYHLNESFAIYDQLLPENAHQYLSVCSTLANLLVAAGDYKTAEEQYSHVIWLMLENGYEKDSQAVREFSERVLEVRRMAQNGSK